MRRRLPRLLPTRGHGSAWTRVLENRDEAPSPRGDRVLVAGWFTWNDTHATAGDLLARDVACDWLHHAGRSYDVANAPRFGTGVDWTKVDPTSYSEVVFVCGPVTRNSTRLADLLGRFGGSRHIGLDLTMVEPPTSWNPFDLLYERDSPRSARPELAFVSREPAVPILGVILVEPYPPEYPDQDMQREAREAAHRLAGSRPAARVQIDTRLDANTTELLSASEVESLIARMDAVVTTRLHGLVLAVKNGVPAVAIDPVAGGSKIVKQAKVIGWPVVRSAEVLDDQDLSDALDFCLSEEGRTAARACAERAATQLETLRAEFISALDNDTASAAAGRSRVSDPC